MKTDFNIPQRQSLVGIFVMGADSLQGVLRGLFPIIVISIFKGEGRNYFYIISALAILFAIVSGYLRYLNFTFFINENDGEFVVKKGVFGKTRIAIPLNKIQQVNINQNLIQKVLKVHELEVDTAGSAKTEVTIKAITHKYALALKERLLEDSDLVENTISEEREKHNTESFIRVGFGSLLKTGITSNYIRSFGILLAFFISTFQHLDDYLTYSDTKTEFIDEYFNTAFFVRFVATIVFTILFLTLMVNLGRTLLKFYDFKVAKQGGSLLLSHGLINTRNTIIKPNRVQTVTVGRNYFQKKFDINDIKITQASDLDGGKDRAKMAMEIPGVNEIEKNALLEFLLHKIPEKGIEVKPNFRKLIFQVFKLIILPVTIFYSYTLLVPDVAVVLKIVPIYVLFVGVLIYFSFRNSRLFISPDFIIQQHGAWDIDNLIITPHKIQGIKLQQFFWQKNSDVGNVKIYTAGGAISFGLANFTQLKKLTNYWLYQVETTDEHWM